MANTIVRYPAREQAPEIFAMRLKNRQADNKRLWCRVTGACKGTPTAVAAG